MNMQKFLAAHAEIMEDLERKTPDELCHELEEWNDIEIGEALINHSPVHQATIEFEFRAEPQLLIYAEIAQFLITDEHVPANDWEFALAA